MNRATFTALRSAARKANQSVQVKHKGRNYAVGRGHSDRLAADGSWYFDRPAAAETAMRIDGVGFMRRRFGLKCWDSLRRA
jgi:hypothetical protein